MCSLITSLSSFHCRIEEAQRHFKEAVAETMNKTAYIQTQEKIWLAERDHLLSVLSAVQENVPLVTHMQVRMQ